MLERWTILVEFPPPRENELFVIGMYYSKEEAQKACDLAKENNFYGDGSFRPVPVAASW